MPDMDVTELLGEGEHEGAGSGATARPTAKKKAKPKHKEEKMGSNEKRDSNDEMRAIFAALGKKEDRKVARALVVYSATYLLTNIAISRPLTKVPSAADIVKTAKELSSFIEEKEKD